MGTTAELRFGAGIGWHSTGEEVLAAARSAEEAGFDVVTAADHLGRKDPFGVLAAAAAVTSRVRLRTYVLDVYFWNPALLARQVATVDLLSGGRLELGLGAGHMRREHEEAGLPFPPLAERVEALERTTVEVRARLADPEHAPAALQSPVPVSIGGWSPASMRVAARHAEIISLSGMVQIPGAEPGTFTISPVPEVEHRLELLRAAIAAERPPGAPSPEFDALLQKVVVGEEPRRAAAALLEEWGVEDGDRSGLTVDALLESPFLLFATDAEAGAEELRRRADRWGITCWCTHSPSAPALAEVLAAHRGH